MKKIFKWWLMALVTAALCVTFTACGDDDDEPSSSIVGTWKRSNITLKFNNDKSYVETYDYSSWGLSNAVIRGTYSYKNSVLTLNPTSWTNDFSSVSASTYVVMLLSGTSMSLMDDDGDISTWTRSN